MSGSQQEKFMYESVSNEEASAYCCVPKLMLLLSEQQQSQAHYGSQAELI